MKPDYKRLKNIQKQMSDYFLMVMRKKLRTYIKEWI